MTDGPATSATPARPRWAIWLRILVFLSFALNLAVIGMAGGMALKVHRGGVPPEQMVRELGLGPYLFAMDPEGRADLRREVLADRENLKASRQAWQEAFEETLDVLRADKFDSAKMESLIREQADLAAKSQSVGRQVLLDRLEAMTPQERSAYADRLESGLRFDPHRGPPPGHPPHGHGAGDHGGKGPHMDGKAPPMMGMGGAPDSPPPPPGDADRP